MMASFCRKLIDIVLDERGGTITGDLYEEILAKLIADDYVSFVVYIVHKLNLPSESNQRLEKNNVKLAEIWTIKLNKKTDDSEIKVFEEFFLESAVCSRLYFSRLNSLMIKMGGELSHNHKCLCGLYISRDTCSLEMLSSSIMQVDVLPSVTHDRDKFITFEIRSNKCLSDLNNFMELAQSRNMTLNRESTLDATESCILWLLPIRSPIMKCLKSSQFSSVHCTDRNACTSDGSNGERKRSTSASSDSDESLFGDSIIRTSKKQRNARKKRDCPFEKGVNERMRQKRTPNVRPQSSTFEGVDSDSNLDDKEIYQMVFDDTRNSICKRSENSTIGYTLNQNVSSESIQKLKILSIYRSICCSVFSDESMGVKTYEPNAANVTKLERFTIEISSNGDIITPHKLLPLTTYCIEDSNSGMPSICLGLCNIEENYCGGYRIPNTGALQATVFDKKMSVVHIFVVPIDGADLPNNISYVQQKICRKNVDGNFPEYLINFRVERSRPNRINIDGTLKVLFVDNGDDNVKFLRNRDGYLTLIEIREHL